MALDYFFDKNLVFCLEADNQEQLFDQVASLLEEREIVTPTYREALITREKSFPTGLDMEFLGKDLPNVAIPHTDIVHNLAEKVVVVRLEKPVTFHNMIAPDKEVEVSLLFFIINNSSSSQTNIPLALEEIAEKVEAGQLDFLHPLEIGTGDLVKVFLTPEEATEVRFGRFIELDQTDKELAAFEDDKLLAILEKRGNLYKPRKVFS